MKVNKTVENFLTDCWALEPKYRKIIEKYVKTKEVFTKQTFDYKNSNFRKMIKELKVTAKDDSKRRTKFEKWETRLKQQ